MIDNPGIVLLVVAGLAAAVVLLRRHRATTPDSIRVLGRTALHKSAVVAIIAVGEQRLLVGAGEKGVHLITELDPAGDHRQHSDLSAVVSLPASTTSADTDVGRDAPVVSTSTTDDTDLDGALAALVARSRPSPTIAGPRNGLVDRLRELTVRTPSEGRPFRVPLRR